MSNLKPSSNENISDSTARLLASIIFTEYGDKLVEALQGLFEPAARAALLKEKEFLTEKEVAEIFSISPATLRTERSRGIGPDYVKDGKKVLYPRDGLFGYFKERLVQQTEE